jgi:hypothetical protein
MNIARLGYLATAALFLSSLCSQFLLAQEAPGPQTSPPPAVAPPRGTAEHNAPGERIRVPAGTHVAVVLENGISTRSAKPGDALYFRTSFPITQNNHVIVPVGSYLRGELVESKRPGRVKGRGEFRLRLNTLIFPNGYTVDLRAAPRSADTGGRNYGDRRGNWRARFRRQRRGDWRGNWRARRTRGRAAHAWARRRIASGFGLRHCARARIGFGQQPDSVHECWASLAHRRAAPTHSLIPGMIFRRGRFARLRLMMQ